MELIQKNKTAIAGCILLVLISVIVVLAVLIINNNTEPQQAEQGIQTEQEALQEQATPPDTQTDQEVLGGLGVNISEPLQETIPDGQEIQEEQEQLITAIPKYRDDPVIQPEQEKFVEYARQVCTSLYNVDVFAVKNITYAEVLQGLDKELKGIKAITPPQELKEYHNLLIQHNEAIKQVIQAQDQSQQVRKRDIDVNLSIINNRFTEQTKSAISTDINNILISTYRKCIT